MCETLERGLNWRVNRVIYIPSCCYAIQGLVSLVVWNEVRSLCNPLFPYFLRLGTTTAKLWFFRTNLL